MHITQACLHSRPAHGGIITSDVQSVYGLSVVLKLINSDFTSAFGWRPSWNDGAVARYLCVSWAFFVLLYPVRMCFVVVREKTSIYRKQSEAPGRSKQSPQQEARSFFLAKVGSSGHRLIDPAIEIVNFRSAERATLAIRMSTTLEIDWKYPDVTTLDWTSSLYVDSRWRNATGCAGSTHCHWGSIWQ